MNGLNLGSLNASVMQQAFHTQDVTRLSKTKKKLTGQVLQSKHSKATVIHTSCEPCQTSLHWDPYI